MPNINELRLAMYPDEFRYLMKLSMTDKDEARAIIEKFWSGLQAAPDKARRIAITTEAWRIDDGE